jgi:hypothetical protein
MALEQLFDAELAYRPGMAPIVDDGEGELVGSGDGSVDGPSVRGTLRWTLYEGPGEVVCTMNPTLVIETEDGASIGVEARGYGRRNSTTDQLWHVAATLLFNTKAERYARMDGALGIWEGEFDAERGHAKYRAFVQAPSEDAVR